MALATRPIVTFPTEFGDIVVLLEYDNATMRATAVTCHNPSPNNLLATITRDSDGKSFSRTFGPGDTRLDIPAGAANRINLVFNSRGGLDGYSAGASYPAP